uniref:Uncharacterized protein n=1 Tax=viral metagenome TaxID=1070528 RepID=A0A6H1ZUM1_9ZZZZ
MADMEKVSGLWRKETKDGDPYLAGGNDETVWFVFKNKYKEKPNQPDHILYSAPAQSRERKASPPQEEDVPY